MTREISGVERPFVRACKRLLYRAYKLVWPGTRGAPDRMVLKGLNDAIDWYRKRHGVNQPEEEIRGLLALVIEFVELKAPGKKAADHQARRHAELRALGFKVTVVDSPEAVEKWYADRS
jgi:hypothetical protein